MKEEKITVKDILLTLLLFPIGIIVILCLLISTPFDYFKYKRTRYYKDTNEKYSWLCTTSFYIKFYDTVKENRLPIDYYRCGDSYFTGYGYFVHNDTLILNNYEPCYDEETDRWLVEIEDEYVDIQTDVADEIKDCNKLLKAEVCRKAVVLIDGDVWEEHPNAPYDNIAFVPVYDDELAEALKTFVQ